MRGYLWGIGPVRAAFVFISGIFVGMYMTDYVTAVMQAITYVMGHSPNA